MIKGQVISGEFGKLLVRQKADQEIELGELCIAETPKGKILLQVYDLIYGSQISQSNRELISGLQLEENTTLEFMEPHLRNYTLAVLKPLITVTQDAQMCKTLPTFFSPIREINVNDVAFLNKPKHPLFLGKLRSGSKILDVPIYLTGKDALTHHILIPASTGKGKSNLTAVMLWDCVDKDYAGILVLDPHDEYFGRNKRGLKDHPHHEKVVYYSPHPPHGGRTLKINIATIKPQHFNGVIEWSTPQKEALGSYYKAFGNRWIEAIILEKPIDGFKFTEATIGVVKRRLLTILDVEFAENKLSCHGTFDLQAGSTTIGDIVRELEQARLVIIDTSSFGGSVEILIGSLIATEILQRYKQYKRTGELGQKPVISVLLEEAPRVLGKEVLEKGSNIFGTIAREGRKFQVGLIAITQLPSMIPREILANMNTKIILGIEMAPERQAIIESSAQDLSTDARTIASLDKGEALLTSTFSKFAIPLKVPLFEDYIQEYQNAFIATTYGKQKQEKRDIPLQFSEVQLV